VNNGALDLTELSRRLVEAVKMKAAYVTPTGSHEVLGGAVEHVFNPKTIGGHELSMQQVLRLL